MKTFRRFGILNIIVLYVTYIGCKIPSIVQVSDIKTAPKAYTNSVDSSNSADIKWRDFFNDKNLVTLIDTAIRSNADVLLTMQDIEIAKNKVRMKDALLHPAVIAGGALALDKVGRYTSQGAGDASAEITPGRVVPELLTDINLGFQASWEADIWGKLRNSKIAAYTKYLSTVEGKNFVLTNLVSEIANSYYELLSLDNQLEIIRQSIQLQKNQVIFQKIRCILI